MSRISDGVSVMEARLARFKLSHRLPKKNVLDIRLQFAWRTKSVKPLVLEARNPTYPVPDVQSNPTQM